jgi:hypothetical protein
MQDATLTRTAKASIAGVETTVSSLAAKMSSGTLICEG